MKSKFLILIGLGLLFFSACEPNLDIYNQYYDSLPPYSEKIEITFTDADYVSLKNYALTLAITDDEITNANAIGTNKAFGDSPKPEDVIPLYIERAFIALDSASEVNVNFKYNDLTTLSLNQTDTLTAEDYLTFTGSVATNGYFDALNSANSKLPAFLKTKFPDADSTDTKFVCYKYNDGTTTYNESSYFVFNGTSWSIDASVYVLTRADYNAIGITGTNLNFSANYLYSYYLPIYLGIKYPYITTSGSYKKIAFANYVNSKNYVIVDTYFLIDGIWTTTENKSAQFIHNGIEWLFDPSINYTMVKADYQIIVDYIINHPTLNVYKDPIYTNNEWYFGASAYYGNYDLRPFKHRTYAPAGTYDNLTDTEVSAILMGRIHESILVMVTGKYPDALPVVNGVKVYYNITFDTYEPERHKYKVRCLCTDVGVFEYVSGPTMVQ